MKKFLFGLFVGFFLGFFFCIWVEEEEKVLQQEENRTIAKVVEKAKASTAKSSSASSQQTEDVGMTAQAKPTVTTTPKTATPKTDSQVVTSSGSSAPAPSALTVRDPEELIIPNSPTPIMIKPYDPGAPLKKPLSNGVFSSDLPIIYAGKWLNGKPFKIEENLDKIVVLEFWATWCPPCRASIPHIKEMNAKFKNKNVMFVSITDESLETVKKFNEKAGMDWLIGVDSKCGTKGFGVQGIPHAFVLYNDCVIWSGHPMNGLEEQLDRMVGR